MTNRTRLTSGARGLLLAPALALAACTTSAPPQKASAIGAAQPAMATYRCEGGEQIAIENSGAVVRVTVAEADPVELAAAPPGQRSRYGADGYALVLEDRDALWMKAGKAPLTCTR